MSNYLYYCRKCGRIIFSLDDNKRCDCCHQQVYLIPEEYNGMGSYKTYQNDLWDKYVKTSPEFDQYLFDHRDEILAKQSAEFNAKMEMGKAILEESRRVAKCPSCGSSNISKIGLLNRAVSFKVVGFASSKIGKTHKCKNCGSMW